MRKILDNNVIKKILLVIYDYIFVFGCGILSLLLIEFEDFQKYAKIYLLYSVCMAFVVVIINALCGLYNSLWKYAGLTEAIRIGISGITTIIIGGIFKYSLQSSLSTSIFMNWVIVVAILQVFFIAMPRYGLRIYRYISKYHTKTKLNFKRTMIIGAGDAGLGIIDESYVSTKLNILPICLIDDDVNKKGTKIHNVQVLGNRYDIQKLAANLSIDLIILALPSASNKDKSEILDICKDTKCQVKILPGTESILSGKSLLTGLRDVEVTDLLGRDQIKVNLDEIMGYIENKVVLVTGGGGSIGSELCRQIASHSPKQLIIFDIYENNAYEIEQELKRKLPNLNLLALIGSVRDKGKLDDLFNKYKPNIVFHAAAHKHVPLMETSPNESVKNNVFGTLNCARMSDKYGVEKFILISTDKAVNPTNVMGATKRICEMIIQTIAKNSNTDFVAVRFGNVLGSNGSVIPLFKKQIAAGGPVTVTHKDITRFFMTIPEAVSLVLQAGAYAHGGEIFVLDMGKPVRIYDLATNLIKLSGYTPNVDMMIEITGLRPGEKLYEELLISEEGLQKTDNNLIYIGKPIVLNEETLFNDLDKLYEAAYSETTEMKKLISELVPTYKIDKR